MSDEIMRRPPKQLTQKSDRDQIVSYLIHGDERVQLSEPLAAKLRHMEDCADLIRQWGSRLKVVPIIMKRHGLTRSQALRIFEETQIVFGTTQQNTREFWIDILMGELMEDKKKAQLAGNMTAVASIQKNMIHIIEKLMGKLDTTIYDKINPPPITIAFIPEKLKVPNMPTEQQLDEIFKKLMAKKRERIYDQFTEDAEIKE